MPCAGGAAGAPALHEDGPGNGKAWRVGGRRVISIVTPCYNEFDNVVSCCEVVRTLFAEELPDYEYEHIFTDNASTDGTVEKLRALAVADRRVKVILNQRNFGPGPSAMNAVLATSGDAVLLLLAADLQDPPELIPGFVRKWEAGYQVVCGIRKQREEGLVMRGIRKAYYHLVNVLADVELPVGAGDFQLVDRVVMDAIRQFDDQRPYLRGIVASCGFKTAYVEYTWRARKHGKSKNRLRDLIGQGLNGIISFSNVPMRLCMFGGFLLSVASILYAFITFCGTLLRRLAYGEPVAAPGIATLIVAIFLFSGVQLFFLGVLGEYVAAIHGQVRRRPLVIEKERINF